MKTLLLRRYKGRPPVPVLLSDKDYDMVTSHKWWCHHLGYVVGKVLGKEVLLHRFIMGEPEGLVVDHINGNKQDNRRCNLRICTHQDNTRNAQLSKNNTSGRTGVSFRKDRDAYRAYIMVDRTYIHLGHYKTIDEAIAARKRGEQKYFGEFAYRKRVTQ